MDAKGFTKTELKTWYKYPSINPRTNRKIKSNGPTFRLLKRAYECMNAYHTAIAFDLPKGEDRYILQQNNGFLWASIFDGHGGDDVSSFLKQNAIKTFIKLSETSTSMDQSLIDTYQTLENSIRQHKLKGGSTGSTILIHPKSQRLYIAHVGDSRIIAKKNNKVIALTSDHKPSNLSEYKRIRNAGNTIVFHGVWRIGSLAVSRVFGDIAIKDKYSAVISTPDVTSLSLRGISSIILASDGLFDVCTNEEIFEFLEARSNINTQQAAQDLILYARQKGSRDDITIIIIKIS